MKTNTFNGSEKTLEKTVFIAVSDQKDNQIRLLSSVSILVLLVVLIISNSTGLT